MVTWEQIEALPGFAQASPETKAKIQSVYDRYVSSKVNKHDVLGGGVVMAPTKENVAQGQSDKEFLRTALNEYIGRAVEGKPLGELPRPESITAARMSGKSEVETRAQILKGESPGLQEDAWNPVDVVANAGAFIASGGASAAVKPALERGLLAGAKAGAKAIGLDSLIDAGAGVLQNAVQRGGSGMGGQLVAGLAGGAVTKATFTAQRRLLTSLIERGIPSKQAARIVGEMAPEAVEKAVKAIEPTPGRIGKQTPVKRIGTAQAADAARLTDDVTLHPEAEDYADTMADYTPVQGRQGIPPVDAQGRRLQAVTERYRYQQAPMEGPFGVEDTVKPVPKVEPAVRPKPYEVDPYLEQTGGFVPEEGVDVGRRIAIPEGVRHLPEGVTRGEDGKLYISIAPAKRTVKAAPEVAQAVPEVAPKVEAPVAKVKQPWEMSQEAWREEVKSGRSYLEKDRAIKTMRKAERFDLLEQAADMAHSKIVKEAFENKRFVPPEVLAEYPDLAPKVEAPAGKPELVGYEWRNTNGERFRAWSGEAVPAKVSDWSRNEVSAGSGKDIVHVYWIKDTDGTVKPYGKQTALKKLGMGERKLQGALDNITRKESETKFTLKNWEEWATSDPNEARNLFAKRYNIDSFDKRVPMKDAVFYEKDGKYIVTMPSEFKDEIASNAGYRKVGPANKLPPSSGIAPSVPKAAKFSPGSELGIVAPGTVANPVKVDPFATKYMEFSPPKKGFMQAIKDKAKSIYTGLFDETAPITMAVKKGAGKDAARQVDIAIGQTRGTNAKIDEVVNDLFDTVKSTLRSEQEYADWEVYRVARRMAALHDAKKGIRTQELDDATEALARLGQKYGPEGLARFDQLSDTIRRDFDGQVLEMSHNLGQISDETYNAIKNAPESSAYAAFLRIMENEADAMGIPKAVMPGESVKAWKGGHQKISPTLDATVMNLARVYRMADQMKVNNLLVDLRQANPGLQDIIKPVGKVDGPKPPNSFFTYDKGHKVYWQTPADIAEAIQFFGPKPMWEISKWFSPFTRLLRIGATTNPEFMFGKNPLRDMQSSAVIVGTPPVKGFLEGLSHVLKDRISGDEVIRELIKDGGGNASMFALDREAVAGARARKLSWDTKGTKMLKHPVQFLRSMMELAEQSQRTGNYLYLKRQGKSGAEAAVEGARRGTLDFAHFGKHGRSLNGLIAFFNAAMREQDQLAKKLFTEGKDSAKVWLRGSMYLTAPSIALWYMQKDNPRYQELPSWRKYGFWNIVTPKVIISLPRPFSLGMIFAGAPEAALNVAYRKDPNAISNWAKAFADSFFPDFIPTAAKPILEVATNKNLFTGGTVVPRSVEGLPDEMQVTPSTSKTAETVGKYLHYSPAKIDHLIRGYTAGLGRTVVGIADKWLGDDRVRPTKPMAEQIPVVKGLVAKEPIGYGSASVEAFYQLWDGMEKNYRGLKALYEQGDRQALTKRARDNPKLIRYYEDAKEIRKFLTETRRDLQEIQATNELSPDQKKEVMDRIGRAMTTVTGNFLKVYYAKR